MEPEGKCLRRGRDVQINLQLFQQVRTKRLLSDKQNKLYFLSPLNRKGKYRGLQKTNVLNETEIDTKCIY